MQSLAKLVHELPASAEMEATPVGLRIRIANRVFEGAPREAIAQALEMKGEP